jgi:hypothetical protein
MHKSLTITLQNFMLAGTLLGGKSQMFKIYFKLVQWPINLLYPRCGARGRSVCK